VLTFEILVMKWIDEKKDEWMNEWMNACMHDQQKTQTELPTDFFTLELATRVTGLSEKPKERWCTEGGKRLIPSKRGWFLRERKATLFFFMGREKLESYADYYCPPVNYVVEFHVRWKGRDSSCVDKVWESFLQSIIIINHL
jgi:hypothetical protein